MARGERFVHEFDETSWSKFQAEFLDKAIRHILAQETGATYISAMLPFSQPYEVYIRDGDSGGATWYDSINMWKALGRHP